MKKGSAVTTDSRHIRGSIEAISKIKIFKLRVQRYEKKDTETPRRQDTKYFYQLY